MFFSLKKSGEAKKQGGIDLAFREHSVSDRNAFGSDTSVLQEGWPNSQVQHNGIHKSPGYCWLQHCRH